MQFFMVDDWFSVSRITGPRHSLLQLRLAVGGQTEPAVERLPAIGRCEHAPLDEAALLARVLDGVAQANARHGTRHRVTHVRYVAYDTRPESVYEHLASEIVDRLESGADHVGVV